MPFQMQEIEVREPNWQREVWVKGTGRMLGTVHRNAHVAPYSYSIRCHIGGGVSHIASGYATQDRAVKAIVKFWNEREKENG